MSGAPPKSTFFPSPTLFRSALHAMRPAFPFEDRVRAVALDAEGDLLEPAGLVGARAELLDGVAATFRVPRQGAVEICRPERRDRKSTRLNSSHSQISYAVFC